MFAPEKIRTRGNYHTFYFEFSRGQTIGKMKICVVHSNYNEIRGVQIKLYRVDLTEPSYNEYFYLKRRFDVDLFNENVEEIYDKFDRLFGRYNDPKKPEFIQTLITTIQHFLKPIDITTPTTATIWCCSQIRRQWRDIGGMVGERILAYANEKQ